MQTARSLTAPRPAPSTAGCSASARPEERSDASLVAQAQREIPGPSPAFDALVARHRLRVERRAAAILGGRHDAEDAAQDVFLNVFRALPRYEHRQPFAHWLERIVTNTCRMHLRSRRRHERRMAAVAIEQIAAAQRARRPHPEARREALRLCERLSDVNRGAFVLRTAGELPYRDIASALGISESAAKMRVRRARQEAERIGRSLLHEIAQRPEPCAATR